jgi:hypothetical protein
MYIYDDDIYKDRMEARARHAPLASSKPSPGPPRAPTVPVAPTLRPQGLSVRAPALPALPTLRLLPVCVVHYHIITSYVPVRLHMPVCVAHYRNTSSHRMSHHHITHAASPLSVCGTHTRMRLCLCVRVNARARVPARISM